MSESQNDKKIAAEWIKIIEDPSSNIRENDIYPQLAQWIESENPKRILEIGCGQGICSSKISLEGKFYTGLDRSQVLIDRARSLYTESNKKFVIGTAEDLPFEKESFDAVFLIAVFHLLPNLIKAANEIARVLSPNGSFFIISANPDAYNLWTKPYLNSQQQDRQFSGDCLLSDGSLVRETLVLHSREEILESLRNANLNIENIDTFRQIETSYQFIQICGTKKPTP